MARDVPNERAGAAIAEAEQVVEIASDALRRHDAHRDVRVGGNRRAGGEQLHLQVVSDLHLLRELLLRERRPNEACRLDRRPDLRRDRRHELAVAGREGLARAAVGEIHDAER